MPSRNRVLKASALGAIILFAAGIPALYFALGLRVDNRIEQWLDKEGVIATDYSRYRDLFGSDEYVVAAYTARPFFSEEALDVQLAVLENLETIPDVLRVYSIPGVFRDRFGNEHPEALEEDFSSTGFYKDLLISRDGTVAGFLIETAQPEEAEGRRVLMDAIRAALAPMHEYGYEIHLAGPPLLNVVLDETSGKEARRIFPLAFVCAVVGLAILLRSIRATAVAVICACWSVLLTLGLMGVSGRPLTMVTSVLPSLLWVLALSNMVHILHRYRLHHRVFPEPQEAMFRALKDTTFPCALASLTTAFGFLSLGVANMIPVRELGIFAAIGMLLSLGVILSLGPWLVILLKIPPSRREQSATNPLAARITAQVARHAWKIGAIAVFLIILSALTASYIQVESDPLTFLSEDSMTVTDYNFVGSRLTGYYSLELVLHLDREWLDSTYWPYLENIRQELETAPGVIRVLSPLDFLKKLNQWNHDFDPAFYTLPENREAAETLLEELDEVDRKEWGQLVAGTGDVVHLSALINVMDSRNFNKITDKANNLLQKLPPGMGGFCTGVVYQLVSAQASLVQSQLRSIALAFCLIFICIFAGLRSWRLTLVSFLPNVLPLFTAFTVMTLCGIPLDAATVMMASVALGIAVDDTVHLLSIYQRNRKLGRTPRRAVESALSEAGSAMAITTMTACIGFFTLMRSSFVPIAWFGMLSGIAMFVALAADIFMGPALLLLRNNSNGKS